MRYWWKIRLVLELDAAVFNKYISWAKSLRLFTKNPTIHHIRRLQEGIRLIWSNNDLTIWWHHWRNCLGDSCFIRPVNMPGWPSGTRIWAICIHHKSATKRFTSFNCDILSLKTISWRLSQTNSQRTHSRKAVRRTTRSNDYNSSAMQSPTISLYSKTIRYKPSHN